MNNRTQKIEICDRKLDLSNHFAAKTFEELNVEFRSSWNKRIKSNHKDTNVDSTWPSKMIRHRR